MKSIKLFISLVTVFLFCAALTACAEEKKEQPEQDSVQVEAEQKEKDRCLAELIGGLTGYFLYDDDSFVGASADWTAIEKGIPSVTVECGRGHNPLPLSQQSEIAEKLRDVFIAVAETYG